ncbi:Glutamyl-tRNA(Gln) synthetase [hydrothermal vent metagenome]|uniref:Glutamyl-tRNA(Gln) synthetase n=1 Tax=hydrothermal vent metagenome TaxID=652676 RepID=A0A1W1EHH6_9ZZZZ
MLRFALSPIRDIYIDDLRVAIFNYLYSQKIADNFILRIEDIDKKRDIIGKDEEILMILEKFALPHSQLYYQSENLHIHQTLAIRLLQEQKAFISTCLLNESSLDEKLDIDKLKNDGVPFVIRIKEPNGDNFIILKEDNTPTQIFATACDDMLTGVDFIIRKDEYINDTPKQEYIKSQLGYDNETKYIDLPAILNPISVKSLLEDGFLPDAIINYLILIGNRVPKEIFTMPEAIEWFELENISKEAIDFDIEKLKFLNREHLRLMDSAKLSSLFGFDDVDIGNLAKLYLQEVTTINELKIKIEEIFSPKDCSGEFGKEMKIIQEIIINAPMINSFEEFEKYIIAESGLKGEKLLNSLQLLITSSLNSPKLVDIYPLIKSYITEVVS